MKTKIFLVALLLVSFVKIEAQDRRSNPIVSHMFTADPSAHVWQDGRLYVYPSTDVAPPKGYKTMDGYHVFSTDDMITWKDHGQILHSSQVPWGRKEGGFMWAPDAAYKDGTYYYYFPHRSGQGRDTWKIGVATSKIPTSGFKEQGYIKGLKSLIDPCVFTDDDGQSYLFIGGEGDPTGYKLKENMMEIEGKPHSIKGLDGFREGLWMFKRKGKYYIIYPDDFPKRNKMRYAISDNIYGPYECKGVFVDSTDIITMHGSVVEFKDQWYVFYHNGNLSGGIATNRSMCFDPIYFNEDGTINMVKQTLGVKLPTFHKDINFNEMMGTLSEGNYNQKELAKQGIQSNEISSIEIPKGYIVEGFEKDNFNGNSWILEENRIDLNVIEANNKIASIKVSKSVIENLVENPSFELITQGQVKNWYNRNVKGFSPFKDHTAKGYFALQYQGSGKMKPLIQKVTLKPNTNYELSVQLKIKSGTKGKVIFDTNVNFDKTCKFELEATNKTDEWITYKGTFNSGDITNLQLRCITSDGFNGVGYWDNVSLKTIE
ncbi:family 43 glycosylhydrolase [Polaribacter vadi]|uniref:family 43 glycosylhydrolase n=1 Tax=Polaribacter TaxID=52959 RepID=UPI001C0890DE|nr:MULTISPECIES: family 43 glycosylhydrolase [Polaribacter]MBU3011344.1 family 43 glycosylhydrolase [Polaribacter vadi]MDO6741156.1 family 43 glycosylhydrolase [Polaribacter sp. 1_MG-2023]